MNYLFDRVRRGIKRRSRKTDAAKALRSDLQLVHDKTILIKQNDILLISVIHNEAKRLPFFLEYYRNLGVGHFLFVDNKSDDGVQDYLSKEKDVSLWFAKKSYKQSNYGTDWINGLLHFYGLDHWCLAVDPDEFFVYPHMDARSLHEMTEWLDLRNKRSFGTLTVDMYPKSAISEVEYQEGTDPLSISPYFDARNYVKEMDWFYQNLWVQGGVRQRVFFERNPLYAPALNKIPLVKWSQDNVYVSSTHRLLPRNLNKTYALDEECEACGALLHFKFIDLILSKVEEEIVRRQHYAGGREYRAYGQEFLEQPLWTERSEHYENWQQLERLGIMSRGDWI